MRTLLYSLLVAMLCAGATSAATFDLEVPLLGGDHAASFRLWFSEDSEKIASVIVLTPGTNGDGRGWVNDTEWQRLARETGAALLACSLRGENGGSYCEPQRWSGEILLHALETLGAQGRHPELAAAPLTLWGHSAGGQFNFNFACWRPDRVVAFVVNKGAYYTGAPSDATRQIPALFIAGEVDESIRVENITSLYARHRRLGAPWCLAVEPGAGHEVGRTKELGIAFLRPILISRQNNTPLAAPWRGDLTTHEVSVADGATPAGAITAWLPDKPSADAWRAFVHHERMP